MPKRSYEQYCGLANALDLLGERWTLLVLRELMTGPKRFGDLLEALPGIGTGLLSDRLRSLQASEVVSHRRLPPPAGSAVYELTDAGRELEPVLLGLARWGAARLGPLRPDQAFHPAWALIAMRAGYDQEAARGVTAVYEIAIGDERFGVEVDDGRVEVHAGPPRRPDVRLRAAPRTLARVARDPAAVREALAVGELDVEGDPEAVARLARIFAPVRAPART